MYFIARWPCCSCTYASHCNPQRSVVSASGSLDGQLSAYTGVSVNGQGSISGLSVSGNGGNGGALGLSGLSGSFSNDRVATPPLLGGHSYANRPKATTGVYIVVSVLMLALVFPIL
jgi:hypothetical protein